jgi:membrane protease YdiL (CAAX protease family)
MLIERQADRLRVRWTARPLPLGAVTGLAIGGLILLAYRVPALHAYAQQFGPTIRERLGVFGVDSAASYGLFCAFLAVLHSGIEEYYWRWYVFGTLLRFFPMGPSVLVAALGFAAHHYVVLGCYFGIGGALVFGTGVGIGGALWCWMMRRQDSVLGAWLSHALVDAAIFVVGYDLVFASQ